MRHALALANQEDVAPCVCPVHQQPAQQHTDHKEGQRDWQAKHRQVGEIGKGHRESSDAFIAGGTRDARKQQGATAKQVHGAEGDHQRIDTGVDDQSGVDQTA
ncbi:hypothetical protein D3C75_1178170 [compost metagenome]